MASTTFTGPVISENGFIGEGGITVSTTGSTPVVTEQLVGAVVPISSAEILTLFSVGKTLIADPGAGNMLLLDNIVLVLGAGTAYTIGSATNLTVKAGSVTLSGTQAVTGFLDQAAGGVRIMFPVSTSITPAHAALTLNLTGADVTSGTGSITAYVNYRIVPIA